MSERTFPAWLEIDVEALQANYRAVRRLVGPDVCVIASVKADAYSLGAVGTARAFQYLGAFALATGSAGEALAIRDAGVTLPILLFSTYGAGDVPALLDHGFIPYFPSIEPRMGALWGNSAMRLSNTDTCRV